MITQSALISKDGFILSITAQNPKERETFFQDERALIAAMTGNENAQAFILGGRYLYTLFPYLKLFHFSR